MQKWNYKTKEYEEYTVPDSWKVKTFSTDMEEKVNCAACGKVMEVGDGYTSRTIHTINGFGYLVCERCYNKEINRELTYGQIKYEKLANVQIKKEELAYD